MTKERAFELLNIYGRAWVTRDADLIATIFTEDATYNDPHEPENVGRDAIRAYWLSKVVGEQKDISFKLLNHWVAEGGGHCHRRVAGRIYRYQAKSENYYDRSSDFYREG
jgi:nuclear transport factor 2 (NTF2) superfamily protein